VVFDFHICAAESLVLFILKHAALLWKKCTGITIAQIMYVIMLLYFTEGSVLNFKSYAVPW
jgi:hypothetical protein